MSIIQQKGFDYSFDSSACVHCRGFCCRGRSGHVWLDETDMNQICVYLAVNRIDFLLRFTNRVNNRISLKEVFAASHYACIFFDNERSLCNIYEVRPEQCRRFPFWNYFKDRVDELVGECPGIIRHDPKPE